MKQFKITFTISYEKSRVLEETIAIDALHDKEAVIKFSKAFPDAQITELVEILEPIKD